MKKEKKFIITCPYCGKELFKSRVADTDVKCSKCGEVLNVEILDGHILFRTNVVDEIDKVAEEMVRYEVGK